MLSRNKKINFLHTVTGWSYKKCRTKLKANNWSLYGVIQPRENLFKDAFSSFYKAIEDCSKAVTEFVDAFSEALKHITID